MRKAFVLCPVVLLAAMMSGCAFVTTTTAQWLIVTRDIAPGDVIQAADLKIVEHSVRLFYRGDWGWAVASERQKVIGHRSKIAMDAGWPFYMSEIEP